MDSELVVRQLNGVYKVKDKKLVDLYKEIKEIIKKNSLEISFQHLPRENNKIADGLVNQSLDKRLSG